MTLAKWNRVCKTFFFKLNTEQSTGEREKKHMRKHCNTPLKNINIIIGHVQSGLTKKILVLRLRTYRKYLKWNHQTAQILNVETTRSFGVDSFRFSMLGSSESLSQRVSTFYWLPGALIWTERKMLTWWTDSFNTDQSDLSDSPIEILLQTITIKLY